jgi:hypothetical protein
VGNDSARCLVELLARPPAPVRTAVVVQQVLELLQDLHGILDTSGRVV